MFSLKNSQVKSRGCEEIGALEDVERTVNSAGDKSPPGDEEKLATGNLPACYLGSGCHCFHSLLMEHLISFGKLLASLKG